MMMMMSIFCKPRRLHTGDKVEFNTVDFVESRQSPKSTLCFNPVHTGDKFERTLNIRATESTELATMSTATSCRSYRFVTKSGNIAKSTGYGDSRLCC